MMNILNIDSDKILSVYLVTLNRIVRLCLVTL